MPKSEKPRVITRCVANIYASPNERIIEFSGTGGEGGLIAFRQLDGKLIIDIYQLDDNVIVHKPSYRSDRK